jgi:hypothetical protein
LYCNNSFLCYFVITVRQSGVTCGQPQSASMSYFELYWQRIIHCTEIAEVELALHFTLLQLTEHARYILHVYVWHNYVQGYVIK